MEKIRDIGFLLLLSAFILSGYNTLELLKRVEKLQKEIIKRDSINIVNIKINIKLNEELQIRKELFK